MPANQLPHEEPKIEAARVDQQSLQNVGGPAEVHAAHPARLVEMREGPLQVFAAEPQQSPAARATDRRRLRYTAARASGFFFTAVEDLIQSRVERMRSAHAGGRWPPTTSTLASRGAVVCPSPSAIV